MDKDGAYHVAGIDEGQQVRLSEDYFISTSKANPPSIAINKPGGDYRASPIEEVTVGVKAGADFGLTHVSLHYSVNGGDEQTVNILKQPGAKDAGGNATLNLEDFKLQPGDVVSLYATAKDAHAETKTEISFIQVDPFEREFSQSQQSGGGGGGGGGGQQQGQTDIARREKELIEATWKQVNDKKATPEQSAATGKLLSEAQVKLREQALALSARMQSRDLSQANEEFNSFDKDMEIAAAGMQPSADKLKAMQWQDAMRWNRKSCRPCCARRPPSARSRWPSGSVAEAVAAVVVEARDAIWRVSSIWRWTPRRTSTRPRRPALPRSRRRRRWTTRSPSWMRSPNARKNSRRSREIRRRTSSSAGSRRCCAARPNNYSARWSRCPDSRASKGSRVNKDSKDSRASRVRKASRDNKATRPARATGAVGTKWPVGAEWATRQSGQAGQSKAGQAGQSQSASRNSASGTQDGGADPRVTQALARLRAANDEMKRAGSQNGAQSSDEAKRAADRLREATDLLGGAQKQQASGRLDTLGREADRLLKEEGSEAARVGKLVTQGEEMSKASHVPHPPRPRGTPLRRSGKALRMTANACRAILRSWRRACAIRRGNWLQPSPARHPACAIRLAEWMRPTLRI